MANLSMKTMIAALLAGSIAATAGGVAFAKTDGQAFDPAKVQQRIEMPVVHLHAVDIDIGRIFGPDHDHTGSVDGIILYPGDSLSKS